MRFRYAVATSRERFHQNCFVMPVLASGCETHCRLAVDGRTKATGRSEDFYSLTDQEDILKLEGVRQPLAVFGAGIQLHSHAPQPHSDGRRGTAGPVRGLNNLHASTASTIYCAPSNGRGTVDAHNHPQTTALLCRYPGRCSYGRAPARCCRTTRSTSVPRPAAAAVNQLIITAGQGSESVAANSLPPCFSAPLHVDSSLLSPALFNILSNVSTSPFPPDTRTLLAHYPPSALHRPSLVTPVIDL